MTQNGKKRKNRTVLDRIQHAHIEVEIPRTVHPVHPVDTHLPGITTETTDIGVAKIRKKKALYIRLSLRSDSL